MGPLWLFKRKPLFKGGTSAGVLGLFLVIVAAVMIVLGWTIAIVLAYAGPVPAPTKRYLLVSSWQRSPACH